ncbi:hypothetical protein Q1695_005337 [Nippostrongylus brasiliensis]|nr:hypothetical protein Q1695_005337 [Nippostrongylus brasiliensis]
MNVNPFHSPQQPTVEGTTIGDKLASLHSEMASLRLECDRLINKHLLVEKTLSEGCILCPNPDTSSAYNTGGESCRSNSITPDGTSKAPQTPISAETVIMADSRSPRLLHRSRNMPISPTESLEEASVQGTPAPPIRNNKSHVQEVVEHPSRLQTPGYADELAGVTIDGTLSSARRFPPLQIIPTRESLECAKRFRVPSLSIEIRDYSKQHRTSNISVQQTIPMPKYFRSVPTKEKLYIIEKPVEEANEVSDDHGVVGPSQRADEQQSQTNETIVYKWKVKRRCDGSRYVVKRPARSQILKKRAAQLIRERTGISTDDDAMSELKLGHFHTREERKKHLEEERRRKIRNQQKLIESKISPADQMIVQLSQRKMQRRKEKMLLDGFVTTQEVLSQRNPDTTAKHGILSVTTV